VVENLLGLGIAQIGHHVGSFVGRQSGDDVGQLVAGEVLYNFGTGGFFDFFQHFAGIFGIEQIEQNLPGNFVEHLDDFSYIGRT